MAETILVSILVSAIFKSICYSTVLCYSALHFPCLPVATCSWRLSRLCYLYFKVRVDKHFTNEKLHALVFLVLVAVL